MKTVVGYTVGLRGTGLRATGPAGEENGLKRNPSRADIWVWRIYGDAAKWAYLRAYRSAHGIRRAGEYRIIPIVRRS